MRKYNIIFLITFLFIIIAVLFDAYRHKQSMVIIEEEPVLVLIDSNTTATIYHAVKNQCDSNPFIPANPRFRIDPDDPGSQRVLAMERTMMKKHGLHWGDTVYVEGVDSLSGYWQIQDTMNKRFAGQSKIDLLVNKETRHGKWENVKVYKINR